MKDTNTVQLEVGSSDRTSICPTDLVLPLIAFMLTLLKCSITPLSPIKDIQEQIWDNTKQKVFIKYAPMLCSGIRTYQCQYKGIRMLPSTIQIFAKNYWHLTSKLSQIMQLYQWKVKLWWCLRRRDFSSGEVYQGNHPRGPLLIENRLKYEAFLIINWLFTFKKTSLP